IVANEDRRFSAGRLPNGTDAGVGQRAPQERDLAQAGELDVVDVTAAAAQKPVVFLAQHACADALALPVCGVHIVQLANFRIGTLKLFPRTRNSPLSFRRAPKGASPESIFTGSGYGFRAPSLGSGPGMTMEGLMQVDRETP